MNRFLSLFLVVIIVFGLIVTNPSKAEYYEWALEELTQELMKDKSIDPLWASLGMALVRPLAAQYLKQMTITHNFVVFTIYETRMDSLNTVVVLGIARNFVRLGYRR